MLTTVMNETNKIVCNKKADCITSNYGPNSSSSIIVSGKQSYKYDSNGL